MSSPFLFSNIYVVYRKFCICQNIVGKFLVYISSRFWGSTGQNRGFLNEVCRLCGALQLKHVYRLKSNLVCGLIFAISWEDFSFFDNQKFGVSVRQTLTSKLWFDEILSNLASKDRNKLLVASPPKIPVHELSVKKQKQNKIGYDAVYL